MPRPTKFSESIVQKLVEAFEIGASITQACSYADISRQTFYKYLVVDTEFFDKIYEAKNKLRLEALKAVSKAIRSGDVRTAVWYLEKSGNSYMEEDINEIVTTLVNESLALPENIDKTLTQVKEIHDRLLDIKNSSNREDALLLMASKLDQHV